MSERHDLIVIGGGITGLSAAKEALQAGLSTALVEGLFCGGLVLNVNHLDGEIEGSGPDLASRLMSEVSDLGGDYVCATVTSIARDGTDLVVDTDAGACRARAVVVASGARLRRLGIPGEAELEGNGVSQCADCDGSFHQGSEVVVVGGGDSALQEALVLAEFARRVHLVHRGTALRAQRHLVERAANHPNIVVHCRTRAEAVLGEQAVRAVRVARVDAGANACRDAPGGAGGNAGATGGPTAGAGATEIACTGFFAYVGLEPACAFVPAALTRDAGGFLVTDAAFATAIPGVFAAGAVRSDYGGMLAHAVAEGRAAARSAAAFIGR